ncbi:MAG TPA: ATP-binding protein [Polyangiaceae bacterium]
MSSDPQELTPSPGPAEVRPSEPAQSGGRRRSSEAPLVEPWREVLLRLAVTLPIDDELSQIAQQFIDGLATILPLAAVGACIVTGPQATPLVISRLPTGSAPGIGRDPTRLFPWLDDERIFDLEDGAVGSTFHLGAVSAVLNPLQVQIAEQAALVLSSSLRKARAYARAQDSARSMQKLQAQVIQSEKLASLGQIVAGVVHELNNPLTSIIAYADYLKRKAATRPPEEAADDLERLRRIGEAAARILNFSRDLVTYARPSVDVPGAILAQNVLEKALVFCEHEFAQSKTIVQREYDATLPPVRGIAGQLTQVFVNLFTNAAHAMAPEGGLLHVVAHHDVRSGTLTVEVSDSGSGIDPADMPQIFEPFFTTKTEGRGTGLGLSIVRGIVDAHGGTIQCQSTLGSGTTFTLTLPLAAIVPSVGPPAD